MTVKTLIGILQKYDPESEVQITESSYGWMDVLIILEGEDSDNYSEIHF